MATPKQVLLDHLQEHHRATSLPKRATLADLQRLHRRDHWSRHLGHLHGPNPNLGPDSRPEGWTTGTHVLLRPTGI